MKHVLKPVVSVVFALAMSPLAAKPYCEALLDKAALPEKYARIAPIYSDSDTGWIFASNQLRQSYEMKDKPQALMDRIVAGFEARGAKLVILVAPPRPVIAGQGVLRRTMGQAAEDYNVEAARDSFLTLLADLRASGAMVPDLQSMVLSDPELRRRYYFRRDTHWTTVGAVRSAEALAATIAETQPDLIAYQRDIVVEWKGKIEEKGSLSAVVQKVCGERPKREVARTAVLASAGVDLLSDMVAVHKPVALVGTSFSDRYKRDHYRVADALAASLGVEVENHSKSGGGMTGSMLAFLASGQLENGAHDLVIWELPYTQNFNSTKRLGQIVKALEARPVTN